jgi:hypothetical protein
MRKPRSDSKLLNLPQAKKDQILDWIEEGQSYASVLQLIAGELGIRSSSGALSGFYQQEMPKRLTLRRVDALHVASEIVAEAKKRPAQFNEATTEKIAQTAFELAISPQSSPKVVKTFFDLVLKSREQDLDARRVALMEQRAAQAEKAQGVMSDSKLTESEKQTRLRQIFGAA